MSDMLINLGSMLNRSYIARFLRLQLDLFLIYYAPKPQYFRLGRRLNGTCILQCLLLYCRCVLLHMCSIYRANDFGSSQPKQLGDKCGKQNVGRR